MMFGRPTIKKRVMAVIESKIQEAETEFREGCEKFDKEAEEAVEQVYIARDAAKDSLGDSLVKKIIGKIL